MVEYVVYEVPGRNKNYAKLIIIGILAMLGLILPFTAETLRYQLGAIFRLVFNTIGIFCLIIGGLMTAFGFISLFMKRMNFGMLIVGALLLWIGSWITGIAIDFLGFTLGAESPINDPGYH
ncbi:MAG: hypothetical protein EU541_06330 [Promethearchaeota archaeon]|nr:MAG: hypothetical protein EU541_06330 [Candidatus Lokiarchaeota archaeon]